MLAAQEFSPQASSSGFTFWHLVAIIGAVIGFNLVLAFMALWFKDRKSRRVHEEQMLALQSGLLPPEWAGQAARAAFRKGWLWLALGLPVFIAFALGMGTFLLVDANRHSGNDLRSIIITIWLVGGVVGLAAVILGGLGLMADQHQYYHRMPMREVPQVRPAPPPLFDDRDPSVEKFRKQERP